MNAAIGQLRRLMRRTLPLSWRLAIRRAPALIRDLCIPPAIEKVSQTHAWHEVARRHSPLSRPGTRYDPAIQAAKVANVTRAAALLDGVVVPPGEVFSWHRTIGPPLFWRGFRPGPELHEGTMSVGIGGGVCQVANMVFWLGLHAGLAVTERHRHTYDLFPDHNRDVPFGCGATVFYPTCDLKLANPTNHRLAFRFHIEEDRLVGCIVSQDKPTLQYQVIERDHRFVRQQDTIWRHNAIYRKTIKDGQTTCETLVARNRAKVCYSVREGMLQS